MYNSAIISDFSVTNVEFAVGSCAFKADLTFKGSIVGTVSGDGMNISNTFVVKTQEVCDLISGLGIDIDIHIGNLIFFAEVQRSAIRSIEKGDATLVVAFPIDIGDGLIEYEVIHAKHIGIQQVLADAGKTPADDFTVMAQAA